MYKILKRILLVSVGLLFLIMPSFAEGNKILELGENLDFGTVSVGSSATRELTLYNKGDSDLTISNLRFHENIQDIFSGNWSGVIPANGEQNVTITFTPVTNVPVSGLVYVESDKTNVGDRSRSVRGLGLNESSESTRVLRLGKHLDFGTVNVGNSSVKQLAIYNDGNSVLSVNNIRFHEKLKDVYSATWSGTIAPHGMKLVNITFIPMEKRPYNGLVYVESDKTNTLDRSRLLKGIGDFISENHIPMAHAGENQTITLDSLVQLNGNASSDEDNDTLTYTWSFTSKPAGSVALLSDSTIVNPTFTADVKGTYLLQLVVNDGEVNSTPSNITITCGNASSPVPVCIDPTTLTPVFD